MAWLDGKSWHWLHRHGLRKYHNERLGMNAVAGLRRSAMQLVSSRIVCFIDSQSLEAGEAREILFRDENSFILYLSDGKCSPASDERLISLGLREALIWLNEDCSDPGSFWS
ncbi:hypothetical protein ACFIOY_39015 [Bradyrhizobium sp. TZ2]